MKPTEKILLRIKSHRALAKLKKCSIQVRELFNFYEGHFFEIDAIHIEDALKIKSISIVKSLPKHELMDFWNTKITA